MFTRLFLVWCPSFPEPTNQGQGVLSSVVYRDKKNDRISQDDDRRGNCVQQPSTQLKNTNERHVVFVGLLGLLLALRNNRQRIGSAAKKKREAKTLATYEEIR